MLDEILDLTSECKLLAAKKMYQHFVQEKNNPSIKVDPELEARLSENRSQIDQMLKRASEVDEALSAWDVNKPGSDWTLGAVSFGISTHYKTTKDGLITMRMESVDEELPLFEQLAVIREVDLFHKWIPFCNKSLLIKETGTPLR